MERTHATNTPPAMLYSLVFLLLLGLGTALGEVGETPRQGGTLSVAFPAEPPTLDAHWTTTSTTHYITAHSLEGLYTTGLDGGTVPMLAEGQTVSDDGLVYTIKLRRGVPFHHGQELTAADVVASLQRWGKRHQQGKELFTRVESLQALDQYTVQLRLKEKYALVLPLLRSMSAAIYPKEVVDEAGEGEVKRFIGTGPSQLAEHQPQRIIKLVRFEPYRSRQEPPNGYGGGKTAWLESLWFLPMPDTSTRVAAGEAGEADFIWWAPRECYDRLKGHPDLKVSRVERGYRLTTVLNKKHGLFTNVKLRQAVLAALDMDVSLRAAMGHPDLYRLDASLFSKESPWWTDVGRERYHQQDPEQARRLLQEVGYQGEPVRYMTSHDIPHQYKLALATKPQLEAAGFTVELQMLERAALVRRWDTPELWDTFTTDMGMPADPALYWWISCHWPGWNCDSDVERLVHAMATELQHEKRYRLWQDIQRLFWERVPAIHYGHISALRVMRKYVHGPFDMDEPYFWNVWVEHETSQR
jgi:peptide/nickel transport system substrate-binding protein